MKNTLLTFIGSSLVAMQLVATPSKDSLVNMSETAGVVESENLSTAPVSSLPPAVAFQLSSEQETVKDDIKVMDDSSVLEVGTFDGCVYCDQWKQNHMQNVIDAGIDVRVLNISDPSNLLHFQSQGVAGQYPVFVYYKNNRRVFWRRGSEDSRVVISRFGKVRKSTVKKNKRNARNTRQNQKKLFLKSSVRLSARSKVIEKSRTALLLSRTAMSSSRLVTTKTNCRSNSFIPSRTSRSRRGRFTMANTGSKRRLRHRTTCR